MNRTDPTQLRIWQQNLNKSLTAQLHLINTARPNDWDILVLQEPWIGHTGTRSSPHWRVLYPNTHFTDNSKTQRSLIFINTNIPTNSYEQVQFNNADVTGVCIMHGTQKTILVNVYNDCNHNKSIDTIQEFLENKFPDNHIPENVHIMIAGDFNRHHSWWEDDRNAHLTSSEASLQPLLDLIYRFDLRMAPPPGRPTLQALSTGNWTRPDNVWCTSHTVDLFIRCDTDPGLRGPNTDHLPILLVLDTQIVRSERNPTRNFRATDWDEFADHLNTILSHSLEPRRLDSIEEFQAAIRVVSASIKSTIETHIPMTKPLPHTKRWWTQELSNMRKRKNRLSKESYQWRGLPDHPSHQQHRQVSKEYTTLIEKTKKMHWEDWLLNASERDIWTASKYATNPPIDGGGRTRMPTLNFTGCDGEPRHTTSNTEKSEALAQSFFPPPPPSPYIPRTCYPRPANIFRYFTRMQIKNTANKLEAYKAPGPDGIPNVVLKRCIDKLADRLYYIYRAIFELDIYPDKWRESTTVVLRKPGKPSYEEPKAYRPIALLNTLGKLFSSIMADDISHYCETRKILPKSQFGGRPSRSTSDSLLLLTHTIKDAWRRGKVASVLFLDVQGAFPSVIKEVLIHSMRLRGVPSEYTRVTELMLTGRRTRLSFDDFLSDPIAINNGNNQGCPLSMIYYAFYNAGLLEISPPGTCDENQFGYVDDVSLLAIGNDFVEAHKGLSDMMTRPGGAFDWSESHGSQFELSKLAVMNFSPRSHPPKPLTLLHPRTNSTTIVQSVQTYRFLGVLLDPKLRWKAQTDRATRSAEAWINLVRRLTRTSTGVSAKGMRQLYLSIAVPRMTYAAEVWYTLPHKTDPSSKRRTGSVRFTQKLTSAQRRAVIATLGAMRTTADDVLNAHAYIPPPHLLFLKVLIRSATHLVTLPDCHPLHKPVQQAVKKAVKRHPLGTRASLPGWYIAST